MNRLAPSCFDSWILLLSLKSFSCFLYLQEESEDTREKRKGMCVGEGQVPGLLRAE